MAWTDQETIDFSGVEVIRQIGDQVEDFGHRLTVDGVPGTAVALALVSQSGAYRGVQPEFNLRAEYLPTLFNASTSGGGGSFPEGPATVTVTGLNVEGFNTSFSLCDGQGSLHSWAFGNNAGAGGDDSFIDSGGDISADATLATRIETRINAVAIADVVVNRTDGVLTISSTNGIKVFSTDAGVVVT